MLKNPKATVAWIVLAAAAVGVLWFFTNRALTLEDIKNIGHAVAKFRESHQTILFASLAAAQVVGMALSLPTKALLTLLAGALLGPLTGTVATEVGVVAGTSILFFVVRRLLRQRAQARLRNRAKAIERRISERPIRAMIGLRLFITLPYGLITVAAAISSVRFRDFLIGTLIGDIPVVVLYSIAGERLFALTSVHEALSPTTIGILIALGIIFIVGAMAGRRPRDSGKPH